MLSGQASARVALPHVFKAKGATSRHDGLHALGVVQDVHVEGACAPVEVWRRTAAVRPYFYGPKPPWSSIGPAWLIFRYCYWTKDPKVGFMLVY